MTKRRGSRIAGVALAALFVALAAHAQEVHKCTTAGAVSYQAKACPQGDVVLPPPPTPSDEEIRQARDDQSHQRFQAENEVIMLRRHAPAPRPTPTELSAHCDQLNQDNSDALDRREELRAPSELASHAELLQKAEAEVARIAQLATASNCRLRR